MTLSSPESIRTLSVYQTALAAIRAGISFVPIQSDGSKSPALQRWKELQQRLPTVQEARTWFYAKKRGIAFITGAVSGGLEMLDFDSHAVYEQFVACIRQEALTELLERIESGYKERSPKGIHLYYRCTVVEGNKKIAQRPLQVPPGVESKIETRGEGGYSIGAPSCGGVHPSGLPYQIAQGALATIASITPQERALLISVARTLDEMPAKEVREAGHSHKNHQSQNGERLPGHIFNERATWADILEPHGWTWVRSIGEGDFWRRPGKDRGISASTNYRGSDLLYVFSTSTIFEPRVGINKFAAYTFLEHAGDFSASSKALAAQGYVDEKKDRESIR